MQPALIDAARSAMVRLYGTHPLESRVVLTAEEEEERKTFLISLFAFMIHRKTPIDKLLVIGGKNGELYKDRQMNKYVFYLDHLLRIGFAIHCVMS